MMPKYLLIHILLFCLLLCKVFGGPSAEGLAFLEENKAKPGVITLPSGLQYKVMSKGNGKFHPTVDSTCTCHYHGTLIDGTVFDSSIERGQPIDFAPNQVIKGWTEAMQLMVEGDKWKLYINSDLAYGDRGSPPKIQPGATLVFTIEMIKIKGDKVPAFRCDPKTLDGCNDKEKDYIEKKKSQSTSELEAEIQRLAGLGTSKMKPELVEWVHRRTGILKALKAAGEKEEL